MIEEDVAAAAEPRSVIRSTRRGKIALPHASRVKIVYMKSTKEEIRDLIQQLPEDASIEDIQYHLYVRQKIDRGLKADAAGKVITQAEAEQRMARWLDQ